MDVTELLDELEEMVEKGNAIPFSSKAMINPEEFMEVMDELRAALPQELEEAKRIVAERKRIISEAEQEAAKIKNTVESKMRMLVDEDQFVVESRSRGESLLEAAEKQAQEITLGIHRYADKILYDLQIKLKSLNDTIEDNRRELKENILQ